FGCRVVDQKRVLVVRLEREPAAAGFFPGEFLVEQGYPETSRCQLLRGECARRSAAENGNLLHGRYFFAGGRSFGEGILGDPAAPPCGSVAAGALGAPAPSCAAPSDPDLPTTAHLSPFCSR